MVTFSAENSNDEAHLQISDKGRTAKIKGNAVNEICFLSNEKLPNKGKFSIRAKVFVSKSGWANVSIKGAAKQRFGWNENCTLISPDGLYLNGQELSSGEGFPRGTECLVGMDVEVKVSGYTVQFSLNGKKNGAPVDFKTTDDVYFRGLLRGKDSFLSIVE